jgi:cyclic pyranopterin phosphate synthase
MPDEGDYTAAPAAHLMQEDELIAIATYFVQAGVRKIRLTGGEPLVRKDVASIIERLSQLPVQLAITTNATRLHLFENTLRKSSIRHVNISLDTLNRERYQMITRRDMLGQVLRNISMMSAAEYKVRINMVVVKGLNEEEIIDFVALTRDQDLEVRFIEFMPFTGNNWSSGKVYTLEEILQHVSTRYAFAAVEQEAHDTARRFRVQGHKGTFAVISTMSQHFCGDCNRIRLTADGKLKNCLFSREETDLLQAFRQGHNLSQLIAANISAKAAQLGGQFQTGLTDMEAAAIQNRSMISIGG